MELPERNVEPGPVQGEAPGPLALGDPGEGAEMPEGLLHAEVLDQALSGRPDEPDLLYDHAMAAEKVDRLDVLEASLRKLIEAKPDHAHAYNALGYTLADRNMRLPEAQRLIQKALELSPDDAHILDSMGWVLFRMGDLEGAIRNLRRAYALRPDVEISVHLAEVLWRAGIQDEARQLWRAAREREPDNEVLRETLVRLTNGLAAKLRRQDPLARPVTLSVWDRLVARVGAHLARFTR